MNRKGRALIGYMARDQALQVLNGGAQPTNGAISGLQEKWAGYHARVETRSVFEAKSPVIKSPALAAQRHLKAIAARPEIQLAFAPHSWQLGIVDLSVPILTYQSIVQIEDAVERVAGVGRNDWDALMELCLPAPKEMQFEGGYEPAQNAFTISSMNPNLRVMSFEVVDVQVPGPIPAQKKVFGFTFGLGSSYVQFVEYQNRWMVRDGHHRLYGLMKAGIQTVPAVLIRAKNFEETGAGRPGFFGHEQLFGPRPPQIRDFMTDDLSAEVDVRAVRKIVRLRAEEFAIPV